MLHIPRVAQQTSGLLLAIVAVCASAFAEAPDAAEIIRLAFEQDKRNDKLARQYTFQQRIEERDLNNEGRFVRPALGDRDLQRKRRWERQGRVPPSLVNFLFYQPYTLLKVA